MKKISNKIPLIIEKHPETYNGYPFITLLQYHKNNLLTIIDNSDNQNINCYVLDMCVAEKIDESVIIDIANEWFHTSKDNYPISIEFSRQNMTSFTSRIFRTYNTEFITRVIGPVPTFPMSGVTRVKRRKRKHIPDGVEFQFIQYPYIDSL